MCDVIYWAETTKIQSKKMPSKHKKTHTNTLCSLFITSTQMTIIKVHLYVHTPKATSIFHTIEISTFKTEDYLIVCYYILNSVYVKRKFSCQLTMKARKLCLVCDFMAEEADKTAV